MLAHNAVGTPHKVRATVTPKQAGVTVRFRVMAGPNVGDSSVGITDANGRASFIYTGDGGPGTDAITAWIDRNGNGQPDAGEPQDSSLKEWRLAKQSPETDETKESKENRGLGLGHGPKDIRHGGKHSKWDD